MGMNDRARESARRTDARLAEREAELLAETSIDWEAIKPRLASDDERRQLTDAVRQATEHNETVGSVCKRLENLGTEGMALAKKVRSLIPL